MKIALKIIRLIIVQIVLLAVLDYAALHVLVAVEVALALVLVVVLAALDVVVARAVLVAAVVPVAVVQVPAQVHVPAAMGAREAAVILVTGGVMQPAGINVLCQVYKKVTYA
jgi:hypothetical protein